MTDKRTQEQADQSNMEKDPRDWVTGDEPMTGAQRSYLKTLSEEAKQPFDDSLTKAQASQRIDELQRTTGRGQQQGGEQRAPGRSSDGADDADPASQAPAGADGKAPQDAEVDARFAAGADGSRGGDPSDAKRR